MSVPNKAETSYKAQSRTQFRDVMGININDYINTLRVNEFRRLLNDKDVSLEEAVERRTDVIRQCTALLPVQNDFESGAMFRTLN